MDDFDPRTGISADVVSYAQATGRDSDERSEDEQRMMDSKSTEVIPKRRKRRFSATEKLRILGEADQCTRQGELGALLRREAIYSSQLATWRYQRSQGGLNALAEKKRGRKAKAQNPLAAKLAESEKQNRRLTKKLEEAKIIISFQKKFLEMFGETPSAEQDEMKS